MATLTINGRKVTVDDNFKSLSPEEQNAAVEEIARSMPEQISTGEDMVRSLGAGIRDSIESLAGMAGDMRDAQGRLFGWAAEKLGASPETVQTARNVGSHATPFFGMPGTEQVREKVADPLAGDALRHDPQTTAGEFSRTFGQFLPAAAAGPGNLTRRLIAQALLPSVGSETAGQMTEGSAAEPYARIAGALMGGLAPSAAKRAISPLPIASERQAAIDVLRREGVPVTAGQATGNKALRFAESELGGGRAAQMMDDQAEAFTNAAMQRAGASGRATTDNMAALDARLGRGFEDISARNAIRVDQGLVDDMNATMQEYLRVLPTEQKAIVGNLAQDIVDRFKAGGGTMSGKDYQSIRSRLTKRAHNARNNDPEFAEAIRGLRNALDNGMNRSIRPEDAGQWAQLRRQYGNMKTLEKAAVGGGEDAAMGLISPARLRQAASSGNRGGYAKGQGDFSELAHAGQAVMTPLPDSGTASRLAVRGLMNAPTAIGAIAGGASGDVLTGLAGAAVGAAVPKMAGRALMSKPVQSYLSNQKAANMSVIDPRVAAIVAALLGNQDRPAIAP